jgi:prevent-host-death family protein
MTRRRSISMDTQIDVVRGVTNITGLRTKTKEIVERVRTSQRPMLVTAGGEAAVVILDARAYQEMVDRIEELEELEELEASEITRLAEEARRGGGVEAEEGIRIFEAEVDAMIAAHRAAREGK